VDMQNIDYSLRTYGFEPR